MKELTNFSASLQSSFVIPALGEKLLYCNVLFRFCQEGEQFYTGTGMSTTRKALTRRLLVLVVGRRGKIYEFYILPAHETRRKYNSVRTTVPYRYTTWYRYSAGTVPGMYR
jgi:hypothetical protein